METDEKNYKILENASKALKHEGKLIYTALNVLYPLFHSVKDFLNSVESGVTTQVNSFNLMTFRDISTVEFTDDSGNKKILKTNERYFAPSEITWYLKSAKFKKIDIFGCKPGIFSRGNLLTTDDFEMLVVAEK